MKFYIELSADYWDKAPQVKVDINNDVIWDGTVTDIETIKHEKEVYDEEEVKLNITLYSKTDDQTVIENEKVIKDQLLHIKNIEIDDVEIEDLIWEAEYTVNTGIKKRVITLGENGTWCLTFTSPFYLWLLERQTW